MAPTTDRPAASAAVGDFFIANRLRGIPLVSRSKSWQESSSTTTTTTTTTTTSETPKMLNQRASQVGKRDAPSSVSFVDTHGRRIQSQAEILFKQTGSTSAVAQLVKQSTTRRPQRVTTTRRPPIVRTTTTRRPPATSTTRRPTTTTTRRQQHGLAKMIRANSDQRQQVVITSTVRPNETNASTIERLIEPISSHKMSTLAAMSGTVGSFLASTLPLLSTTSTPASIATSTTPESLAAAAAASTTTVVSVTTTTSGREQDAPSFNQHSTTLTRSMQALTTLPVNQRRTQPNLVPVRGAPGSTTYAAASGNGRFAPNDPRNGYAGENWYLFKRSDGDLSAFEILVLLANILIVATIILVILINWIRVFKKKRSPLPPPAVGQQAAAAAAAIGGPLGTAEAGNDRASKMSLISSGGTSQVTSITTSAPDAQTTTTVTTTTTSMANANQQPPPPLPPIASSGQQQQQVAQAKSSEMIPARAKEVEEEAERLGQNLVGASRGIASEVRANVANKAMAIVQPTENTSSSRTQANDNSIVLDNLKENIKDELLKDGGGQRTISRSVSDLSAGGADRKEVAREKKKSADDTTTPERVTALEELFSGTKREIELQKDEEATRRMRMKRKQQNSKDDQRPVHSSSSLESIDLPNNLVESIKRTAPSTLRAQVDETLTPSPNLLLGEVDGASKKPTTVATTADTTKIIQAKPGKQTAEPMGTGAAIRGAELKSKKKEEEEGEGDQTSAGRPQNPMSRAMGDIMSSSEKGKVPAQSENNANNKSGKPPPPPPPVEVALVTSVATRELPNKKPPPPPPPAGEKQTLRETTTKSGQVEPMSTVTLMDKPPTAEVKNHQVVVNKLDKRKTNLEIVDLRDESVTGKMRAGKDGKEQITDNAADNSTSWISMDGVAVVQPSSSTTATAVPMSPAAGHQLQQQQQQQQGGGGQTTAIASSMSPSEIIDSRFRVDYRSKRKGQVGGEKQQDSVDSKQEEYVFNNIENELELDNKMKNRKYFVYIVHDGHFTAKKECIARIELPPKRRITLAELRQLISSSQDISLSSLRRNRFKFVTETYRLLNENEDAAVLHQVYPTQGVFLKLNVNETENQSYAFKGGRSTRLSSGAGTSSAGGGGGGGVAGSSSLSQATIASRRRAANVRANATRRTGGGDGGGLPAIEVNQYGQSSGYGQARAASVAGQRGRARVAGPGGRAAYARSKSSVQTGRNGRVTMGMRRGVSTSNVNINDDDNGGLTSLGMSYSSNAGGRGRPVASSKRGGRGGASSSTSSGRRTPAGPSKSQSIGEAASDLGANMVAGAKKLFSSTFHR